MKNNSFRAMPSPVRPNHVASFIAIVAFAMAAIASFAGCSRESANHAPVATTTPSNATLTAAQRKNITLYTVAPSKYRKTIETTGIVDFDNDQATSVIAAFSGPVSQLLVSPGQHVNKGDALATVDSSDFATAISTYRKAIATAQTNRRVADLDKDLVQHRGVSEREAEQAQTDAANADADRDAALQALVALDVEPRAIKDIQAGKATTHAAGVIRAPIAGTVVERLITPGQLLQAGSTPCFTVADLSRVWVMAQLFGSDLTSIKLGDPAEVETADATKNLSGTVDNISALVDPNTRAVAVRVVVNNPDNLLRKQMYVRVRIQAREEGSGLLVPVSAILRDDVNLPFVYLAEKDGTFARKSVTLGERNDERYNIVAGLAPGDQIVVDGGIFVQFMQNQ